MKAIINATTYDYHEYHENRYIIYEDQILETGPMMLFKDKGYDLIDAKGDLVIPGFVCGHTHLYSAFARGMSIPFNPKSFKEVLKQYWWKLDHFLDLDMLYHSAYSYGLEQLKKGSTTLIDHHAGNHINGSLNKIKEALVDDLGMRAILAFETSDRYDVDAAIKENGLFIKNNKTSFVSGLFGLHASFTLSDKTLKKVSENLHGAGIHIHVAESIKDEEDAQKKYNKTIVERLNDFHLINQNSILVHCTNASEKELKIVKEKDAIIAINVTSNMNNAVGLPNIRLMEDLDIKMMIGNDGLIQSMPIEYLNAYYSSHLQTKNPVGFSIDSIKKMIINAYEYVSRQFNVKIGRIKKNYKADLLIVPYLPFTPINKDNMFGHMFFGVFPGFLPKHVIVNGNHLVKNYEVSKKIENKDQLAKQKAKQLWDTIKKEGNELEFKD